MVDFSRMNGSSFERLVRALAFDIFGPAGTVYSSGPDAARDFTFDGAIRSYETSDWNGYLVVQAKFREQAGKENDAEWLIKQLSGEWEKIRENREFVRPPQYYIVATNVKLSGADGKGRDGKERTGGHTKVTNWLKKLVKAGEIRDFDIWTGDKLVDLLSARQEIRRTFAAWITPGDVLTELLNSLTERTPSFVQIVRSQMRKELRRDQFARLKDAGSVDNEDIPTSNVFVDLPVGRNENDSANVNALHFIVNLSRGCFRDDRLDNKSDKRYDNKIVLMGGPGQGKSTLTTFLAQFFRAHILTENGEVDRDATVRQIARDVLKRAQVEGVYGPVLSRYPVWLSLPKFADAVAAARQEKKALPSLLTYLADSFATTSDHTLTRDDLRAWLALYPWIVIFDGLDEVPASGERAAVLEAIKAFEGEVADANADVVFIVTTRPQGYNHDLSETYWSHWQLRSLTPPQALRYAAELGKALHKEDTQRRADVLSSLEEASASPSTSRLMTNPLQVTILYMIVDTGGGVPPGRWNLFNGYYEVLRRREKAKGGEIRRAIERNWNWLGPIHQRVGLVLHLESELSGGANAYLTPKEFHDLVREYLISETVEIDEASQRAEELENLAVDRLVLLSAREQGRISFDVRSLQEFAAAAALTSSAPDVIAKRLEAVAHTAHWRNVFLIAASRCFDEDAFHWLRSAVVGIPRAIEGDPTQLYLRRGARLALDMFNDGLAVEHPNYRRQLAIHALEMMLLGAADYDRRLPKLYEATTELVVTEAISSALAEGHSSVKAAAAWLVCVELCREIQSFSPRAIESVPSGELLLQAMMQLTPPLPSQAIARKMAEKIVGSNPFDAITYLHMYSRKAGDDENSAIFREMSVSRPYLLKSYKIESQRELLFHVEYLRDAALPEIDGPPGSPWEVLAELAKLIRTPSAAALSRFLSRIAQGDFALELVQQGSPSLPWPFELILALASSASEAEKLASSVMAGDFGDCADWLAAEARWEKHGFTESDFSYCAKIGFPFDKNIAEVGLPRLAYISMEDDEDRTDEIERILKWAEATKGTFVGRDFAEALFAIIDDLSPKFANRDLIVSILKLARLYPDTDRLFSLGNIAEPYLKDDEIIDLAADVAQNSTRGFEYTVAIRNENAWVDAYEESPKRRAGIIKLIYLSFNHSFHHVNWTRLKEVNLTPYDSDGADVASCKALLRAMFHNKYDKHEFVEAAKYVKQGLSCCINGLLNNDVRKLRAAELAQLMIESLRGEPWFEASGYHRTLTRVLDRVPVALHSEQEWRSLQLSEAIWNLVTQRRALMEPRQQ